MKDRFYMFRGKKYRTLQAIREHLYNYTGEALQKLSGYHIGLYRNGIKTGEYELKIGQKGGIYL